MFHCFFFQGPLTAPHAITLIEEALRAEDEKSLDILFYRKNGETKKKSIYPL
jgi:hypothetical protein